MAENISAASKGMISNPNGTCVPPSPEVLAQNPAYLDPYALVRERLLLRIPTWIVTVCTMYIVTALIVHARRKAVKQRGKAKDRHVIALRYGLIAAACFTEVDLIFGSVVLIAEINGQKNCTAAYKAENALFWINYSALYFVLWIRQRVLYQQRTLRESVPKAISYISFIFVALVILLPITNIVIYANVVDYCYDDDLYICSMTSQMIKNLYLIMILEVANPIVIPLALLGLFAWPLICYQRHRKNIGNDQRSMLGVLQRVFIITAICLVTDVGTMVCNVKCPIYISPTFRHFSLFCNLVCLIISLADWRTVLFPMTAKTSGTSGSHTPTN